MKKVLVALLLLLVVIALTACCPMHRWNPASCTTPSTCLRCQTTRGEPLGHDVDVVTSACKYCGNIPLTGGETLKLNTPYVIDKTKIELLSCDFSQWFYQYSSDYAGNHAVSGEVTLKHQAMDAHRRFYKYIRENRCIEDFDYLLLCFKINNLSQQSIDYSEFLSANVMINMQPSENKTFLRQTDYNKFNRNFTVIEYPTAFYQDETTIIPSGESGTYLFLTMVPESIIKSEVPISLNFIFDNVEAVYHVR